MKSQEDCLFRLEEFLPYIDNWASCDIMNPKVLAKDKERFSLVSNHGSNQSTYIQVDLAWRMADELFPR